MVSVMGFPIRVNYCPNCGSYNVIANDNPLTGNGEGKCTDCGAHWIAIEGEDNKAGVE